ncbi:MAG: ABC transporter permease [Halobacteriales archaeon]
MGWYVGRRVLWAVFVTFVTLSITWGFLVLTPDPQAQQLAFQAAQQGGDVEAAQSAAESFSTCGGERSYLDCYATYMGNMATLNWGWSDSRSQPVIQAILDAWPYSLMYAVPSILISTVLGLLIGFYSAVNQYTAKDNVATFFAFFGYSIPNFWFGIVLLVVVGAWLELVPILYDPNVPVFSVRNVQQNFLPVLVLTTGGMAGLMRYSRAQALEYVSAEFVKTARAKGADENRILFRHILRPALAPLATILVGDLLGILLAASYLVEVVFGIPGLGQLGFNAIIAQDTALVLGTSLVPVFIAVIGNLLQDIAYTVLDPRIDYDDRT